MRFCRGCGGILGRDCRSERECLAIREYTADYYDAMAYDLWWSLLYAGPRPTRAVTVPDRMEWAA